MVELLVVIAVIALLVAVLVPSLVHVKTLARETTCSVNLKAQLQGIHTFASQNDRRMPLGPGDIHPDLPEPYNTIASNQILIGNLPGRAPNALGVLLDGGFLQPDAAYCPADDTSDPAQELRLFENPDKNAYSSYLYRQRDGQDDPANPPTNRLYDLGYNGDPDPNHLNVPVSALVMDMNCLFTSDPPVDYAVTSQSPDYYHTNHGGGRVGVGFVDGHVTFFDNFFDNTANAMSIRESDSAPADLLSGLDRILYNADRLRE